jgi:hypothetical protein
MLTLSMKYSVCFLAVLLAIHTCSSKEGATIDRQALVSRHNVRISAMDSLSSLTVGNGNFAFTVDVTGLQSFPEQYMEGIPLGTYSNWGWHSCPNPEGYNHGQVVREFLHNGRQVAYYHDYSREGSTERARASAWLRENPHRMNLGMLGFRIYDDKGTPVDSRAIKNPRQELDLWKGEINSYFEVDGLPVEVITLCDPGRDLIAVRVVSPLLHAGRLKIGLRFPEADKGWRNTFLWGNDSDHTSRIISAAGGVTTFEHRQDSTRYCVSLYHGRGQVIRECEHDFLYHPEGLGDTLTLCCAFDREEGTGGLLPGFDVIRDDAATAWKAFWESGGAVDFSGCTDPRASELERRVVLSQYLEQVNCSGSLPPQETGLTFNSWYGKFHLEMHWWHSVHFALWQRGNILEKQMQYYSDIREQARELAAMQGYRGVRWPKMTDPGGLTSPSTVGNYLIWQQPHYIYFAELLYWTSDDSEIVLKNYGKLVFETADFMASFPVFDSLSSRYNLSPPLISAQETFDVSSTLNPVFELAYWYWALQVAMEWKQRLNLPVPGEWKKVADKLARPELWDSCYLFAENAPDSYSNERYLSDHPMILGTLGMLPHSGLIDRNILNNTFDSVVSKWHWDTSWGWDFPMVSMCACVLDRPEDAISYLLMDTRKNTYLNNGHNYQDQRLPVYLPGNGGLLSAVAMLCTGDGFPKDGNWNVKWENLNAFETINQNY